MSNMKFINILELIGKDFLKGLAIAEKYAVPAATLAGLLYPPAQAASTAVVVSVGLIQTAVTEIEQKYTAAGIAKSPETNAQKLADVVALVEPTVVHLLQTEGVKIDNVGLQNLVNAVVAILKVQLVPAS